MDSVQTSRTGTLTAGALIRRQLRVLLDLMAVRWQEHRGLLDSTFIITATDEEWRRIATWVQKVNGR